MSDTAEDWFNKNQVNLPNMFRHAKGVDCGHNHNTKDTIYIDDVECWACKKVLLADPSFGEQNMIEGKAPETYYMSNKEKKNHNKRKLFNEKHGICPCGCNWQIKRNRTTNQEFLGCVNYPACRNTKALHPLVINFSEIDNLIGADKKRVASLINDIRKEVENKNIVNNTIVATDNRDTNWLFDVIGLDGYKLRYTGTAK